MGVSIKAAIVIGTAAAVYGIAKLRDTSKEAEDAINGVNTAGAKTPSTFSRMMNAVKILRTGAGAVKGTNITDAFKRGIFSALFGRRGGSTAPDMAAAMHRANDASRLAAQAKKSLLEAQTWAAHEYAGGLKQSERAEVEEFVRSEKAKYTVAKATAKALNEEYVAMKRNRQQALTATRQSISATNTLTGVAREARNWYKMLFGTVAKGASTHGLRAISQATTVVSRTVQTANNNIRQSYSNLAAAIGSGVLAVGGMSLLGGSAGLGSRAFSLSREREDAKTTFDTLLGSRRDSEDLVARIEKYAAKTPFQTADIMGASRNLMSISGRDVAKNEHLYKLAAKMAALRPGTTVEEASQAIVRGTFGEFDPLKTFTITASAAKFKKYGEVGGKAYAEGVVKEIEAQFDAKTGGRDIVGALAMTMSGMMSTIKDSLDIPLTSIGDKLVEGLGVKGLMAGYIEQATYFGTYFAGLLSGKAMGRGGRNFADPKMASGVKALAEVINLVVTRVIKYGKMAVTTLQSLWSWFEALGSSAQRTLTGILIGFGGLSTVIGIVTPVMLAFGAVVALLWAPLAAVVELVGSAGVALSAAFGIVAVAAIATLGVAFMAFRNKGESVWNTLTRVKDVIVDELTYAWKALTLVMLSAWNVLAPELLPAWNALQDAFAKLQPRLIELWNAMGGATLDVRDLASVGKVLGEVFAFVLYQSVLFVTNSMNGLGMVLEWIAPWFRSTVSDVKSIVKAFVDLISGTNAAGASLKTMVLGMLDLVVTPFRLVISELLRLLGFALQKGADIARPFSTTIAGMLDEATMATKTAQKDVIEGFLKNRAEALGGDSGMHVKVSGDIKATIPVQLNLDGGKVAEATATAEMRARNSGRGGNPMTPEEIGFVINDGKIRTVDISSVSAG